MSLLLLLHSRIIFLMINILGLLDLTYELLEWLLGCCGAPFLSWESLSWVVLLKVATSICGYCSPSLWSGCLRWVKLLVFFFLCLFTRSWSTSSKIRWLCLLLVAIFDSRWSSSLSRCCTTASTSVHESFSICFSSLFLLSLFLQFALVWGQNWRFLSIIFTWCHRWFLANLLFWRYFLI